jgi:NAD-dependent deacetylase
LIETPCNTRFITKGHLVEAMIKEVATLLKQADTTVALTGAGISVESGIPAFRGAQGLWERYDPIEYASIEAFRADPGKVWLMLQEMDELVMSAQPNPAHQALARLEKQGCLASVVTQNIDGLHQAAGSRHVVEFHGSGRQLRCQECGHLARRSELMIEKLPPRCGCGGLIRPNVVFFGEPIPERAAMTAFALSSSCQVMLVVGTSAIVAPASQLPVLAKQAGAKVVEINLEPSPLSRDVSDYLFEASASQVLPQLADAIDALGGRME